MNGKAMSFHPEALAELAAAQAWYEERNPEAAVRFAAAMEKALETIRQVPEIWAKCDERHRRGIVKTFPYGIIYRVDGDAIRIIAIAHSRRHPDYWKQRADDEA